MKGLVKLHHLIHSLSKTEKRYISIELSKQKATKGKIDLQLFNLLKKQNSLDEDVIFSVREFNSTQKLIIRTNYLFDFILRCLIDYNYSREIEINIGNHIRIVKNFILKGLHQYTHYYLNKAWKLAGQYEDLYRLGILCSLRKVIVNRSSATHAEFFKEIQKIEQQESLVHEKIFNLNSYSNHLNHLSTALKKNSSSHLDEKTLTILNNIIASPLFSKGKNAQTKKAKIIFHQVNAIYHEHVTYDYKQALHHTEKQMELIKYLESYQKTNSPSYITCLKQYCVFSAENHQFDKAKEALSTLQNMYEGKSASKNLFEQSLIFLNYLEAETRLTLIDHDIHRLDKTQTKIAEEIELFDKIFDGESKMIIYFNLSIRLLFVNDYKGAFHWLEKILRGRYGMRIDILQDAYVLSLICIYEIDSVNLFESRKRSYMRHYQQEETNSTHSKIIHLLARIYQHKNNAEHVRKNLFKLETFLMEEMKKNEIDNLLAETILLWIRKKTKSPPAYS